MFSDLSAAIECTERIAVIGASGQGKSTMLRMLARLEPIDEGDMLLNGQSFRNAEPQLWRKQVCYVAQQSVMLEGSIEDNLRVVSRLHNLPYEQSLAHQLLNESGLGDLNPRQPAADLSGGQQQRVALIRALMLRPAVLLLDEATASLDPESTRLVEAMLIALSARQEMAIVWVTHDLAQASRIGNRVWTISAGGLSEERQDVR